MPIPKFTFGTGDTFDSVHSAVPPVLMALAAKGPELLGLQPAKLAATGLAQLAAALRGSVEIDDGVAKMAPAFNLAVISPDDGPAAWFEVLGRDWLHSARSSCKEVPAAFFMQMMGETLGSMTPKARAATTDEALMASMQKVAPTVILNQLRPIWISTTMDPRAIGPLLLRARNSSLTLLNGASDPLADWLELSPAAQLQLAGLLNASWWNKPLTVGPKQEQIPATLHGVWVTSAAHATRLLFDRKTPSEVRSCPVLLLDLQDRLKRWPDVEAPAFSRWSELLQKACLNSSSPVLCQPKMDKVEKRYAESFHVEFQAALAEAPPAMHPYLAWLPELLPRIWGLIQWAAKAEASKQPFEAVYPQHQPVDSSPWQASMRNAIALTRWLCQEHYRTVRGLMSHVSADACTDTTDNTDMEAIEEAICAKLKDKGPQEPRELQRSFHDLCSSDRDKALQRLKMTGRVIETPDGRLEAAA
jgi:hypothetical protein